MFSGESSKGQIRYSKGNAFRFEDFASRLTVKERSTRSRPYRPKAFRPAIIVLEFSRTSWSINSLKAGDYCLLHHYEIGGLLGLWQATSNRGRNLVPKVWGGKFPYQVKVKLVIPKVTDVPKAVLKKLGVDAAVGRFDNGVDEDTAEDLVKALLGKAM